MIYFIQIGNDGPIKIGYSANVQNRIKKLQSGCPEKLNIILLASGGREEEARFHHMFRRERIRGEWFEPTPELINYVKYGDDKLNHRDSKGDIVRRGDVVELRYQGRKVIGKVLSSISPQSRLAHVSLGSGYRGLVILVPADELTIRDSEQPVSAREIARALLAGFDFEQSVVEENEGDE